VNILFCVYHDLDSEERSRELFNVFCQLGNVDVVSRTKTITMHDKNMKAVSAQGYLSFLRLSILMIMSSDYDLFVLHDNYGSLLIPFIRLFKHGKPIVFDSSEFYPLYELRDKHLPFTIKLKAYLLALGEKCFVRNADAVIAANIERASAMKRCYKVESNILIYDNLHRIEEGYNLQHCEEKYSSILEPHKFLILNAGGIFDDRYIYEIADAVVNLGDEFRLVVVGGGVKKEISEFQRRYQNSANIRYLGFVPRNELKFLIQRSDVCFSGFKPVSLNNTYCASGKTYESLMEGTPILCSENPPLKRLCTDFGVGISSNNFVAAIQKMRLDYASFKNNALAFSDKVDYAHRGILLVNAIKDRLGI